MNHQGTQTLHTPRLILRRFTEADAPAMFRNWASDPQVTRYLTWPTHTSEEVSHFVLADWCPRYAEPDYYHWAIVLRELDEPVGSLAVVRQDAEVSMAHVGYALGRRWWRQGLTTEALEAVIAFLIGQVGFRRIEARHDPRNPHSGGVLRRCGMTYEGTLRNADWNNQGICNASMYALLAEDWHPRRRREAPSAQRSRFNELMAQCANAGQYVACLPDLVELAEAGYPPAECQVGWFYHEGLGTAPDPARALAWTRRAADHGDRDAQCNLGLFYEEGHGVAPDPAQARHWYRLAARQGCDPAFEKCRELGISLIGDAPDARPGC